MQVLENYIFNPANADIDLAEPRWELFAIRYRKADRIGCDELVSAAKSSPLVNLLGYVQLLDFIDYATALIDVPVDRSSRLKAPEHPLDTFGVN